MSVGFGFSVTPGDAARRRRGDATRRGPRLRPVRRLGFARALPGALDDARIGRAGHRRGSGSAPGSRTPSRATRWSPPPARRPSTTSRPAASTSASARAAQGSGTSAWAPRSSPSWRPMSLPSAACSRPAAREWQGHALTLPLGGPPPHPDHHGRPRLALAPAGRADRRRRRDRARDHAGRRRVVARAARRGRARRRPVGRRPRGLVHVVLVGRRGAGQGEGGRRLVGDGVRPALRRLGRRAQVHPRGAQGAAARDRQGLRPEEPRPPERGAEGRVRRARRPARRRPLPARAVHVRRHSRRGRGAAAWSDEGRGAQLRRCDRRRPARARAPDHATGRGWSCRDSQRSDAHDRPADHAAATSSRPSRKASSRSGSPARRSPTSLRRGRSRRTRAA